jgi:ATP-dependent DNA helicase RecG
MRLYETGGILHTEQLPVARTSFQSLDIVRIDNYLRDIINDPEVPTSEKEWKTRLSNLSLLTESADMCTIAGFVLFGKKPRQYLKQSGLRVFAFDSPQKEYKALLDTIIDSPLVGRWDFSDGSRQLIDNGIIENVLQQIDPFISEEADTIDQNFRRHKHYYYPVEAIREVIVNALVHRDWTRFVDIEIGIYSDRFEIISPGSLQNSMTIEKMIAGQRYTRNNIIMEIMRDYRYVDFRGMGIRTKVIPKIRQFTGKNPVFEATEDYVKVVLPKIEGNP